MNKLAESPNNIPDLKRLLDSYGNDILRICYLYLHDMQLAEDAVQETYIKVYKNWNQFKGEAAEKTWITKIAMNVCNSMRRSKWYQVTRQAAGLDNGNEISYDEQLRDDTVLQAIYQLKPKYKEVIILFYYEEMKGKEIAKCLGIGESTVTVRLSRARAILKQSLKGWYFNE